MKAKDYVEKYGDKLRSGNTDDDIVLAAHNLILEMMKEATTIAEARKVVKGESFIAILREQDAKYRAVLNRVDNPILLPNGFKNFVCKEIPMVAPFWNKK